MAASVLGVSHCVGKQQAEEEVRVHADSRAAVVQPASAVAAPAPLTLTNFFSELGVRRLHSLFLTLV